MNQRLRFTVLVLLSTTWFQAVSQVSPETTFDHSNWYAIHPDYKESAIQNRFFKQDDIRNLLDNYRNSDLFHISVAGESIEGREIYRITLGSGPTDILLWSQMHGDEPTATMAIMDILNFFASDDQYDIWKHHVLDKVRLHFIPMLNPDGAQDYSRFNALGIDLNRDAIRLQCPESRILKDIRDETEAEFGFNLHDQSRYYSAGRAPYTASISFLSPAFNYQKEIDEVRGRSMRLVAVLDDMLQHYIPNQVAKFSDDFEPRAFGDNIQKWGTSTILIESGGLRNDPEKQELRRLHFTLLLHAFESIADSTYSNRSLEEYEAIPENDRSHHDLLLRKIMLDRGGKRYKIDLAFKRYLRLNHGHNHPYYTASIVDIGDLSTEYGYTTLNGGRLEVMRARVSDRHPSKINDLSDRTYLDEIRNGRPVFQMNDPPPVYKKWDLPCILTRNTKSVDFSIFRTGNPIFYLGKNNERQYLVTNGQLFDLDKLESYFNN